ncbi:serine aminopeptidase domain-containing protein [Tundrisphaera lichenicola]|uniref:serine aminopeptidase domain-containing protein n=1 Tax=Tundrisphaera lichenicola TaxID=2029860 RepID=UPI003EBB00B1
MLYTKLLNALFRTWYGKPEEVPEGAETGLVLMADGVGGLDLCEASLRQVMSERGGRHKVRFVPWGHGLGRWHADLTDVANHKAKARLVVEEVLSWKRERPESPVYLVGKSGGTGIVVRAMEELPVDSIEAAVLLAPALSPGYDLSKALRAIRREMVVFWSPLDMVILGAGTWLFKTVDRVRSVGAGMVGFRRPLGLDEAARTQYAKLRQVRWNPKMASTGYLGGHVGPDSPAFLRKYVVPLLSGPKSPEIFNFPRDQAHPTPRR